MTRMRDKMQAIASLAQKGKPQSVISGVTRVFSDDIAVDLGTANTLVYTAARGIIIEEPSVVAVQMQDGTRAILGVGAQAKAMYGRTPEPVELVRPLRDGVIADFLAAEEMLRQFLSRAKSTLGLLRPRILICVPSGATPLERKAVYETAMSIKASKVLMIEEPVAAAVGAGLPIEGPQTFIVVDIGGGTSDIAVMRDGRLLVSRSLRVAGNAMDEAIIAYVRGKYRLLIGEANAERIKIEAGSAGPEAMRGRDDDVEIQIRGREIGSGLQRSITLSPRDVAEALAKPVALLGDFVERLLEDLPRDMLLEIANVGIVLTGGGALRHGLDKALSARLGMRVGVVAAPMHCVIRGTAAVLSSLSTRRHLLLPL